VEGCPVELVIVWIVVAVVLLGGILRLPEHYRQGGWRQVAAVAAEDHRRCVFCGKRLKYESWASMKRKQVCKWCGREQGWSRIHAVRGGRLVEKGLDQDPSRHPSGGGDG
jgi:hypothetical protein